MVKTFLVVSYVWQEDVAKIFKVPEAYAKFDPGYRGNNMVSMCNHLLYHFSIETIHLHLASFYALKHF